MAKTREIKGRMKAVANIQRITKTMQMIATARFQAAQKRATSAQPYSRKIRELVDRIQAAGGLAGTDHPLLRAPAQPTGRHLLLVITSNRGMCGGYNANILRTASAYLSEHSDKTVDLEVVGKKGVAFFKFAGIPVSTTLTQFSDVPELSDVYRVADRYINVFTQGRYDQISIAYMAFQSVARQRPEVLPLLPLQGVGSTGDAEESGSGAQIDYDFSPTPGELIDELLPVTVKTQLMQCFNEAAVGEQVARMVAMKSATESATKMGKSLTRSYNRARQAAITTELSEIIAGSAALE